MVLRRRAAVPAAEVIARDAPSPRAGRPLFSGSTPLQPRQVRICIARGCAAHLERCRKAVADLRSIGMSEDRATMIVGEMNATNTGGFAIRHARDRRRDRRRDATCTAASTAIHALSNGNQRSNLPACGWIVVGTDQDVARLRALRRTDDAVRFHDLDETRCARVAELQPALQVRSGRLPRR